MKLSELKLFMRLSKYELLAVCILGEARGEPIEGKVAVGCVIRNRLKKKTWYGDSWHKVILKAKQFTCFNGNEKDLNYFFCLNLARSLTDEEYKDTAWNTLGEGRWVAIGIIDDLILDNTRGAVNYYNPSLCQPKWADKMIETVRIGGHFFLKER